MKHLCISGKSHSNIWIFQHYFVSLHRKTLQNSYVQIIFQAPTDLHFLGS